MSAFTLGHTYPNLRGLRVGIIGAGGVGKAHAIAALKSLATLSVVIDVSLKVLRDYTYPTIVNSWGEFTESAELNCYPRLLTPDSSEVVDAIRSCDLCIIAVPDKYHQEVLTAVYNENTTFIVEKPYCCTYDRPNIYMSSEWLYSSLVQRLIKRDSSENIESIVFWHNNATAPQNIKFDLFPHVLSIGYKLTGSLGTIKYSTKSWTTDPPMINPNGFSMLLGATSRRVGTTAYSDINYKAAYNPLYSSEVLAKLFDLTAIDCDLGRSIDLCRNNELLIKTNLGTYSIPWEANLFANQLDQVMRGNGIKSSVAVSMDTMLREDIV